MVQATVNLQVRLPEELRQKLVKEAETNKRSLNSEVVWRLEQSLVSADTRTQSGSWLTAAEIENRMATSPELRKGLAALLSNMPDLGPRKKAKKE